MTTDKDKIEQVRKQVEARKEEEEKQYGDESNEDAISSKFIRDCLNSNELGDGILFKTIHRDNFLFNKSMNSWMSWTGHHWDIDIMDQALAGVEKVVDVFLQEFSRLSKEIQELSAKDDQDDRIKRLSKIKNHILKRISRLRSSKGRKNCLHFAHTCEDPMAIRGDEIDCQPWLFACKNGVIDLRTGKLRDGTQDDYLLKASPIEWKGIDEPCELWEQFLFEIFSENIGLVRFAQRLFGYAMIGMSMEHIIAVLSGQGRNGKGTIVEILSYIMGKMAGPIRSEMLLDQSRNANAAGPTPDIMALRGLRLAFASETDQGCRVSPARVKWLTGNDELTGRNPHDKYEVTFRPTHTLFLLTNHKPHAPADDFAFWERVHLIPFRLSYVNRKPREENERPADKELAEKLKKEAPGILAWLVKGCLYWQKYGLNPPPIVKDATAEYRRDEDILADFIDERCYIDKNAIVGATDLYTSFEEWWRVNVSKNVPKQRWFGKLVGKRFDKDKVGGVYKYFGIGLLALQDHQD